MATAQAMTVSSLFICLFLYQSYSIYLANLLMRLGNELYAYLALTLQQMGRQTSVMDHLD